MSSTLATQSLAGNPDGTGNPDDTISPLAGKPAPKEMLLDVARLERDYFERHPDVHDPNQLVSSGSIQADR